MQLFIIFIAIFLFSVLLTGLIRFYALRKKILDVPNNRSSHQIPTPRGGGISFVLICTGISIWLAWQQQISPNLFYGLLGGLLIAAIGWLDDVISIHAGIRAFVHVLSALWAVYWLGNFEHIWMSLFATISIVWCINLYNFMDGIDGLAGVEGLFISLSIVTALSFLGISSGISTLCLFFTAAMAGFLVWNWSPAKIFMGDVGSGYLGYLFSILAIETINLNYLTLTFWLIIAAVFLCDATFTVLYRIYRGERWYQAHREHAYQRLVQLGTNHQTVTLSILLLNIFVLFPVAFITLYYPNLVVPIGVLIALFFAWIFIIKKSQLEYKLA